MLFLLWKTPSACWGQPSRKGRFTRSNSIRHRTNQQCRIKADIEPVEPPVEMRTGHPTGRTDGGDDLPLSNLPTDFNQNLIQMQKGRGKPMAVVDNQGSAGKKHPRMSIGHHPASWRLNRCTRKGSDIDPEMGLPGFTIENSLTAIDSGNAPGHWPDKSIAKIAVGVKLFANRCNLPCLPSDPLQIFCRGFH